MDKTYTLKELADLDPGTTIVCDTIPFIMTCSFFYLRRMGSSNNKKCYRI